MCWGGKPVSWTTGGKPSIVSPLESNREGKVKKERKPAKAVSKKRKGRNGLYGHEVVRHTPVRVPGKGGVNLGGRRGGNVGTDALKE